MVGTRQKRVLQKVRREWWQHNCHSTAPLKNGATHSRNLRARESGKP
jgi:hypothetical protein